MIEQIGFIGGGTMAEAIVRGILAESFVSADRIVVSDPLAERRQAMAEHHHVQVADDNLIAAQGADLIVLAIKPQQLAAVMASLRGHVAAKQVVLSIMAGVSLGSLVDGLSHQRVVRVMPNTPAQFGAGMSVWTATREVQPDVRIQIQAVLRTLGREVFVDDEKYLDMATAINGSGPAYVFLLIEAMIDAGVHLGLSRPLAEELVIQTVFGAALMAQKSGMHPAQLKNLVTSPGGTTAAALAELEDGRLRTAVDRAVGAAFTRGQRLGH